MTIEASKIIDESRKKVIKADGLRRSLRRFIFLCPWRLYSKGRPYGEHYKSNEQEHVTVFGQNLNLRIMANDSSTAGYQTDNP
jgi:hypothetical protein